MYLQKFVFIKTVLLSVMLMVMLMALSGCGGTVTQIDYLETDTFISSTDLTNHAALNYLEISKSASGEERIIVKLPTGKRSLTENFDAVFSENPIAGIALMPFLILIDIIADLLSCKDAALNSTSLTSAKLVFDISDNQEGSLTSKISMGLLSKPWWQSANWERAHHFSSKGRWVTQGGDLDSSFAVITGSVNGSTLEFDVTSYFKTLISNKETTHYGLLIKSETPALASVRFDSTQTSTSTKRPRLVSTYQCLQPKTNIQAGKESVYYLGLQ
ncbi:MAG: DNRLRE domain-containing protein [Deltaproteobacteria bacterium]|nr:DNRLRE domain-containing protein [Deltaproteobacteria bacterium]